MCTELLMCKNSKELTNEYLSKHHDKYNMFVFDVIDIIEIIVEDYKNDYIEDDNIIESVSESFLTNFLIAKLKDFTYESDYDEACLVLESIINNIIKSVENIKELC